MVFFDRPRRALNGFLDNYQRTLATVARGAALGAGVAVAFGNPVLGQGLGVISALGSMADSVITKLRKGQWHQAISDGIEDVDRVNADLE